MNTSRLSRLALCALILLPHPSALADPCGMVPPIYRGQGPAITRVGLQQTYVFYRDGVETLVLRPAFSGKVDQFGMLIPFPSPPAIRKVQDGIFDHLAAAADPPEVVINLMWEKEARFLSASRDMARLGYVAEGDADEVVVLRREAVGMYEVAVLDAGSAAALKRWMDEHGFVYPKGMDQACQEYVDDGWCFVAVKTRVGTRQGTDPRPGMRDVDPALPDGATFDGNVQAMGFRFKVDELVVPMRLSSFNPGELRNVVYLLTDDPHRVRSMPREFTVRQIEGAELYRNVTAPLPLRIIGGTMDDLGDWHRQSLPSQRDPAPHNGFARELFASDLLAAHLGRLAHPFEEEEKRLLDISERLGMRGPAIDALHAAALQDERERTIGQALEGLKEMTLTVIDGDFPRDVLARENLTFARYEMPADKNNAASYSPRMKGPAGEPEGDVYHDAAIPVRKGSAATLGTALALLLLAAAAVGIRRLRSSGTATLIVLVAATGIATTSHAAAQEKLDAIQSWIALLSTAEAPAAIDSLAGIGPAAIDELAITAQTADLTTRGYAIAGIAAIGGGAAIETLDALRGDPDQPELARAWAFAGRIQVAETIEDIETLVQAGIQPTHFRPVHQAVVAILARSGTTDPIELMRLQMRLPYIEPLYRALTNQILRADVDTLTGVMRSHEDGNLRRTAAAFLATKAGDDLSAVARATLDAYAFDPTATDVPWKGGPLFVPGIAWPAPEARELARHLVAWHLFLDIHGDPAGGKDQLHNNLRSLNLANAAGYQSPGWQPASTRQWLTVWRDAFGKVGLRDLLSQQGVADREPYAHLLR